MWLFCMVLAVVGAGAEEAALPMVADDSTEIHAGQFPRLGRTRPGLEVGTGLRWNRKYLSGQEFITTGALSVRRGWRTSPDSTSSLSVGILGPSLAAGIRPGVALLRRFPRQAAPPKPGSRAAVKPPFADTWRAGLSGPWLAAGVTVGAKGALGSWTLGLGRPAARWGEGRLTRRLGTSPSTAFAWRRDAGARVALGGRFAARRARLDFSARSGAQGFSLVLDSPRPSKNVDVAAALARGKEPARVPRFGPTVLRLGARAGPWSAGYAVRLRGDSSSMEGYLGRRFAGRAGRLEALASGVYGPSPEARGHLGYSPPVHLGPLWPTAGAGVRAAWTRTRVAVRPELTAAVRLRSKYLEAGAGWTLSGVRGTARLKTGPGLSLRARPGSFLLECSLQPSVSGLRWSAAARWRP